MEKSVNGQVAGWWAPLCGVIAGLVYLLTLSSGVFPGESATLVATGSGLAPSPSMANPLWKLFAAGIAAFPVGSLATRFNLFSALCGGLSVGLMFRMASHLMYRVIDAEVTDDRLGRLLSWIAGVCSALFLAFCIPFWSVSTRAHTASFDIMLLLTVTLLCLRYEKTLALRDLCLCLFLYGIGMAEFATFIVFAPLFALFILFQLWVHSELNTTTILASLGSFIAGLLLYALAAWRFTGSELHVLQWPVTGFWDVFLHYIRSQHSLILHSLPGDGWLLIVIVTIIPWLTMLLVANRALNTSPDVGQVALHVVMTVIAFLVLFSGEIVTLSKLGVGRLLVTPFLLSSMVYGYLAAYWCLMLVMLASGPRWGSAGRGRVVEVSCISVFVGLAVFGGVLNLPAASGKGSAVINRYANDMYEQLNGRRWVITQGELDHQLRLLADNEGERLNIINRGLENNDLFLRYMASLFENPRIKGLADVGLVTMLSEWFKSDEKAPDSTVFTVEGDLWGMCGRRGIPAATVYEGIESLDALDASKLMQQSREFWDRHITALRELGSSRSMAAPLAIHLLREMSRKANNLGVVMEDVGREKEAFEAYTMADTIVTNNLSSQLNRFAMIKNGYSTPDSLVISQQVNQIASMKLNDDVLVGMMQLYGVIRAPMTMASMGMKWAARGAPSVGVEAVKRAAASGGQAGGDMQKMLAELYLTQDMPEESEAVYREMLTHHPEDGTPYLGLARVAASRGDRKRASDMLEKASKSGVPPALVLPEQAQLFFSEGKIDQAKTVLDALLTIDTNSVRGLTLDAAILIREGELEQVKKVHLPRLASLNELLAVSLLTIEIAMKQQDFERARVELERVHELRPNQIAVLSALVNLDMMEGRKDEAAVHVKKLLSVMPDHPMGNYVLAKLQMERGEYALAESSLRRALLGRRAVGVLNDLAVVLIERDAFDEAETLIREAIAINEKTVTVNPRSVRMFELHDTLGMVLMGKGNFAEAEKAFDEALKIAPGMPGPLLHLVELALAQERRSEASDLLITLRERRSELSSVHQRELDVLLRELE